MAFKDDFLKALHGDGSLYDAFVRLSERAIPADADVRYQYLRSPQGKFIARDEADVDVYVVHVAKRHIPKFQWLYDGLFKAYPEVFGKDIDLVVWGCGCGLDLLALYDRALEQKNPQLWTKIRSVTLVDASKAALERAKVIAEVLFPLAAGSVRTVVCDLARSQEIKRSVSLRPLTAYLPRIHLISNLLDLFDDATPFATAVKECAARNVGRNLYFNDLVVAFSPEYRGGRVARNVAAFKCAWDEHGLAEPMKTIGDVPLNCEFCAFAYRTLAKLNDRCYLSYMGGKNRSLNSLVAKCPTVEHGFDFHAFVTALSRTKVNGMNFFRVYQWVETRRYKGRLERVVFVPDPDLSPRPAPCVVEIVRPGENVAQLMEKAPKRALDCLRKRVGDEAAAIGGKEDDFTVWRWDGSGLNQAAKSADDACWSCDGETDYSRYFRIDVGDAEPLPDIELCMDKKQREIVFSRAQYRKLRGSAGCGKSTTMMWHAVMAVLRLHLPVLLVCRTVTLFSRNKRRIAATLKQQIPELEHVDSDLVKFMTLDKVLCQHVKDGNGKCQLIRCIRCCGCDHQPVPDCRDYRDVGRYWRKLNEREKNACCDVCEAENIGKLSRKGTQYAVGSTVYGAVMIDEVQSVSPSLVQAVVNLTYGGNQARECYVFCDERQCLNPEAVEIDPENRKLRVKVPDRGNGYGRWVDLNKPYRTSSDFSGRLADVAVRLQALTAEKYGAVELARHIAQGQMTLSSQAVFSVRRSPGLLMSEVQTEIFALKELGADSVTVVCDDPDDVRLLLRCPDAKEWRSTHLPRESHVEEQKLRMLFREMPGEVQLTTVTLAQGWDFANVIYVCTSDMLDGNRNVLENVLTGATRATSLMRILDRSPSGWLYETLKELV